MTYNYRSQKRGPYDNWFSREARTPGDALRIFRKSLGLTQAEFAEPLPIGRTAIVNYENGMREVTTEALDEIRKAYPTAIEDLPLKGGKIWSHKCKLVGTDETSQVDL